MNRRSFLLTTAAGAAALASGTVPTLAAPLAPIIGASGRRVAAEVALMPGQWLVLPSGWKFKPLNNDCWEITLHRADGTHERVQTGSLSTKQFVDLVKTPREAYRILGLPTAG